jgi:hypothetical protein
MTGVPLRPTDVLSGAGRCEFHFEETIGGAPKDHELAVEVSDSDGVIQGTAHCSERTPGSGGTRKGISVSLVVTGSRTSAAGTARPQSDLRAAVVVAACQQRDGDALWKLLTPRFQSELDRRATQIRRAVTVPDLDKLYGHSGRPRSFSGLAFLRHSVQAGDSPDNPCWDVEHWRVGGSVASSGRSLVTVERPDGFAFSLRFTGNDRAWKLDQISKSLRVSKP